MFDRLRFARYALRFERAFRSDDWSAVKACFHPDGRYVIEGTGTDYDGEYRGPDEIVGVLKRMLDDYDRKFDKRSPRLASLPRKRDGAIVFDWTVRYTRGESSALLHGSSQVEYVDGKIALLRDRLRADEVQQWAALATG